jgi:Fe-Mn family superoxide dismutase
MIQKTKLNYKFDELEPIIDKETMEIHYDKHYATYVEKLNEALNSLPQYKDKDIYEIVSSVGKITDKFQNQVRNNGGGVINHNLYWEILTPGGRNSPEGKLLTDIKDNFGSFQTLKTAMIKAGTDRFGSGWIWLVYNNNKLEICSTANQDNPIMGKEIAGCSGIPILAIDVWEHAYYLKHQNKRADYLKSIWDVINFEKVEEIYEMINN